VEIPAWEKVFLKKKIPCRVCFRQPHEMLSRINADRHAADKARAEQLAARYLEEDAAQARLVAAERLETDQRLAAEGLVDVQAAIAAERQKIDAVKATRIAAERQMAEMIEAEKIAAERLEEDRRLVPLRKHRRTDRSLVADMKRVFAELFEEKDGEYLPIDEVYAVFEESTSLANANYHTFKRHCRKLFLAQWKNSRVVYNEKIPGGSTRCFTDMAVKRPQ
jgi:hypothetical protein